MRVEAVVTKVEGEQAWVRVSRPEGGCGRCQEPGGCRSDMLAEVLGPRCNEYALDNALHAQAGARVGVEVPDGLPLRAAAWAYGLPLAGLLLGAALGRLAAGSDAASALGSLLGLVLAWLVVGRHGRLAARAAWRPRLVEILS